MAILYNTSDSLFEITIQRKNGNSCQVVVRIKTEKDAYDRRCNGQAAFDTAILRAISDPKDYGISLGRALFRDGIGSTFKDALSDAQSANKRLRVLLTVEDEELQRLHWQRLCYQYGPGPFDWDYLSGNPQLPFSQYLPTVANQRFPPIGRKDLRVLLLVAGPNDFNIKYGLEPFDVARTVARVRGAMKQIPMRVLASIDHSDGPPTLSALCEELTRKPAPTLLHIVCHGRYNFDLTDTVLYFPDSEDHPVTGSRLLEALNGAHPPYFTFLMSCESATPDVESYGGLGQRMVLNLGMPAVLAMTSKITIETAGALAEIFYDRLMEHGEVDRALGDALYRLRERRDRHVPALFSRQGDQPLFSDNIHRELTPADINAGLEKLQPLIHERAPTLERQFHILQVQISDNLFTEDEALSEEVREQQIKDLEAVNTLCFEVLDMTFPGLALGRKVPQYDSRCPFPGLTPFQTNDREFFFGRENLVIHLIQHLDQKPFLSIIGPSGSGKSSLILAGLIPTLQEQGVTACCFNPGAQPVSMLDQALAKTPSCDIVIVDQMEEIFTLCRDKEQVNLFIERLIGLVPGGKRVAIAIRTDFLDNIMGLADIRQMIEENDEFITPLNSIDLRSAIEQQAARVGLRFEAGLAQSILKDVGDEPGAMPLLQHALLLLWQRRHGRWLRNEEYDQFGGVKKAIAHSAETIYTALSPSDKNIMRDIFLRLTRISKKEPNSVEQNDMDTRRRVEMRELIPANRASTEIEPIIQTLANARLIITSYNSVSNQDEVDVSHEALIRYWPRLQNWIEQDREDLAQREEIREAALAWEHSKSHQDRLIHRDTMLLDAIRLSEKERTILNDLEQRYIGACKRREKREKDQENLRRKLILIIATLVVMVLGLLSIYSGRSAEDARRSADLAERSKQTAQAAVTEQVRALITSDAALQEARDQRAIAEASQKLAEERRREAETQRLEAEAAKKLAEEQQAIAEANAEVAAEKVKIARARELADLSNTHQSDDLILSYLLGIESYRLIEDYYTRNALLSSLFYSPYLAHNLNKIPGNNYGLMEYSRDGEILAVAEPDGTVRLVDAASGAQIVDLKSPNALQVSDLAFSPDGKTLAVGGRDGVALWDLASYTLKATLQAGAYPQVVYHNNQEIYTAIKAYQIEIWSTLSNLKTDSIKGPNVLDPVTCLAVGIQKQIALCTAESGVYLRRPDGNGYASILTDKNSNRIAFSTDGLYLAVMNERDKVIDIWSRSVTKRRSIQVDTTDTYLAFSAEPNTHILAYSTKDNTIIQVDIGNNIRVGPPLKGHTTSITGLAYGTGGRLATGSDDHFFLWDTSLLRSYTHAVNYPGSDDVDALAFSADGQNFLVGGRDRKIRIFGLEEPEALEVIDYASAMIRSLAVAQDGRIAVGSAGFLDIFSAPSDSKRTILKTFHIEGNPNQLLFTGEVKKEGNLQVVEKENLVAVGRRVSAEYPNAVILFYNPATGDKVREINVPDFHSFAVTGTGRVLISSWEEEHILVRDAETNQVLFDRHMTSDAAKTEENENTGIWTLLSTGGDYLYIFDKLSGEIHGFYIPSQIEVLYLPGWKVEDFQASISQNGLIFGTVINEEEKKIRLVNLDMEYEQAWLCDKAGRNLTPDEWVTFFPGEEYRKTCNNYE